MRRVSDPGGRAQRDPSLARRGTGLIEHVPRIRDRSVSVLGGTAPDRGSLTTREVFVVRRKGWGGRRAGAGRKRTCGAWATRGVRDVVAGACDRACRSGDAVASESCDGGGSEESVRRREG